MAFTMTKVSGPRSTGAAWRNVWNAVPDNSWTAAGESLTRVELGFASTADPTFDVRISPTGGYLFEYDHTNQAVLAYRQKDPANAGGADIPMPAVANSVDLSGLTLRITAEGRYIL